MTIKEAILKSMEELDLLVNYSEVTNHIIKHNYYDFKDARTPTATISALLGDFVRVGDSRIKRIKKSNSYFYYLAKNENKIDLEALDVETDKIEPIENKSIKIKDYAERDLHFLLNCFLKNSDIYSKTIFHEQSNSKDSNQIWTHPDIIGIKLLNFQTKSSQNFIKAINRLDILKLYSYELKKEINNDSELKKAYFQAVSNSSWANYGYLVALEISENLYEEMERLNQSFGVGVIQLNANPFQSKILFQSKLRNLDLKTIDKLCKINSDFGLFFEQVEKLITASEKYYNSAEREFDEFCDKYSSSDSEIANYCKNKNIPNVF